MKKNDFILIALCLLAALTVFGLYHIRKPEAGPKAGDTVVEIFVGGEKYGIYDLNKDQVIDINGSNTLLIEDGVASMTDANCPDLLCTYQRPISKNGESIICLPNRVLVVVKNYEEPSTDAVAN